MPPAASHTRRSSSDNADEWATAYESVCHLELPKVANRHQGKVRNGFLNGFATCACYDVACGGLLLPDKSTLQTCLSSLDENQLLSYNQMLDRLQQIASFQVTENIGTWVGNTAVIITKDH
jgi:hypothetical protein